MRKLFRRTRLRVLALVLGGLSASTPAFADEELSRGAASGTGKEIAPRDPAREVPFTKQRALQPMSGLSQESIRPRTDRNLEARGRVSLDQTGCSICMTGSASVQWTGSSGSFHVDTISNNRSSGTSGPLDLRVILTVTPPVFTQTVNYWSLSNAVPLSPLAAGYHYSNVSSGTVAFLGNTIPAGEYFVLLYLRENVSGTFYYADWITMDNKVSCNGAGCSTVAAPSCTENANTMCLLNGRYKVTSRWKNQYAGGAEANLQKARLTDTTGAFWLFDAGTYEYVIRVNTATDNGRAWITILTFTSVEFWMDVTDTVNGQFKQYHSEPGNQTTIYDPYFFVYP